jgi:hypothetical protein
MNILVLDSVHAAQIQTLGKLLTPSLQILEKYESLNPDNYSCLRPITY